MTDEQYPFFETATEYHDDIQVVDGMVHAETEPGLMPIRFPVEQGVFQTALLGLRSEKSNSNRLMMAIADGAAPLIPHFRKEDDDEVPRFPKVRTSCGVRRGGDGSRLVRPQPTRLQWLVARCQYRPLAKRNCSSSRS